MKRELTENLIPKENQTFEGWTEYDSGENLARNWNFEKDDNYGWGSPYDEGYAIVENGVLKGRTGRSGAGRVEYRVNDLKPNTTYVWGVMLKNNEGLRFSRADNSIYDSVEIEKSDDFKFYRFEFTTKEDTNYEILRLYGRHSEGNSEPVDLEIDWHYISEKDDQFLVVDIEQDQRVDEWSTNKATRIRTYGGKKGIKYAYRDGSVGLQTLGLYIRNNHSERMEFRTNRPNHWVEPKETKHIVMTSDSDKPLWFRFSTDYDLDITVWRPSVVNGDKPHIWLDYDHLAMTDIRTSNAYITINGIEYGKDLDIYSRIDKIDFAFDTDGFIGGFGAKSINVEFYYGETDDEEELDIDIVGSRIELFVGFYEEQIDDFLYKSVGLYNVLEDDFEDDDVNKIYTFTAYDDAILFDKAIEGNLYIELEERDITSATTEEDEEERDFSILGKDVKIRACSYAGVPLKEQELMFDNHLFEKVNIGYDERVSWRQVISEYAQANLTSAFINFDGELEFADPFREPEFSFDGYDFKDLSIKDIARPINSLVISRGADGTDETFQDVFIKDEESVDEIGLNEFKITNNSFLYYDTEQYLEPIFEKIKGYTYFPLSSDLFIRPDIEPYSVIETKTLEGESLISPVNKIEWEWTGGLGGTIESSVLPETITEYELASLNQLYKNIELRVDKANGEIVAIVEKQEEIDDKIVEQEVIQKQTADKLETEVIKREEEDDLIREQLSSIEQTVEGIEINVQHNNGQNRIKNSVFYNDTEHWKEIEEGLYGEPTSWSLGHTSKNAILGNGTVEQQITIKPDVNYTLSGIMMKNSNAGTLKVYYITNEEEHIAYQSDVEDVGEIEFQTTIMSSSEEVVVGVSIEGSNDGSLELTDLMLASGDIIEWSPHPNEIYSLKTLIDENGIRVKSSDGNGYTVMNPKEFASYFNDEKVFTINQDISEVMGLKVKEKGMYVPPIKWVQDIKRKRLHVVWTGVD